MKRSLLIITFGLLVLPLLSQTYTYEYLYDAAGNRTRRTVIIIPNKAADSLSADKDIEQGETATNVLKENLFDNRSISIFPNPTTGELVLEITPLEAGTKGSISIYTMGGSLLIIQETLNELNRLDLSDLLPGSYLLHITLDDKTKTYKIIKQ